MAIGLESHFGVPNLPYIRASLDTLAAAGLPIWLTEVDVKKAHKQVILELIPKYSSDIKSGIIGL